MDSSVPVLRSPIRRNSSWVKTCIHHWIIGHHWTRKHSEVCPNVEAGPNAQGACCRAPDVCSRRRVVVVVIVLLALGVMVLLLLWNYKCTITWRICSRNDDPYVPLL